MSTYDEIMARIGSTRIQGQKIKDPSQLAGIKVPVNCICPECDHKFVVIVVVNQVGILLLSPHYDKKGRMILKPQ